MSNSINNPSLKEFEAIFVNNADLSQVTAYLNRFNPIRVMRMEGMEVRHSNILAWLLDPVETHGFGDRFLKAFLSEALRGESAKGRPTALEVTLADLRDVEVRREWQHIDIFLLSRRNNWAFIIENKFHSSQHAGQLAKYARKVQSAFEKDEGCIETKGIFLTLQDEQPEDVSYASIGYQAICEILSRLMEASGRSLGNEVRVFLNHYIEVIQEAAGMSNEHEQMEQLARSLYRQHRKVLDFIWEHGTSTSFSLALDDAFGDGWEDEQFFQIGRLGVVNLWSSGDKFSFLPRAWYDAFGGEVYYWPGCEKWWSGYPVICWLQMFHGQNGTEGSLRLFAEVGPLSDYSFRKDLIQGIKAVAAKADLKYIGFQKTAADEGKKYSKFLKGNSVPIKDVQDFEEISRAISGLTRRFQASFDAITPVLEKFHRYGVMRDV